MSRFERLAESIDWRRSGKLLGVVVFLAVLAVFVTAAVPQTVGADASYVVLSDSMSPSIDAGAVVYVAEVSPQDIETGDVVTYLDSEGGETRRVTHRVVEVVERDGQRRFRTQGDANEEPDPGLVRPSDVTGVVQFDIPLVGYGINLARSPLGIVALVVVPAGLLVLTELWDLYGSLGAEQTERDQEGGEQS